MGGARFVFLCIFTILASPTFALAAPCGGDVDGKRIACRCGDTVVSDTRLLPDDPVVTTRCTLDGLTIRAAAMAESIRLELDGLELHGSGVGIGIRVADGGSDGALVIGSPAPRHGIVTGFGVGLVATEAVALARVSRLDLRDNRNEGARVTMAGAVFEDVVASGNGRDGLHVRGNGGRLSGVASFENGENGIRIFSNNAAVDAAADRNARSGLIVDGEGNDLDGAQAVGNGRDGIVVRGSGGTWEIVKSQSNARDDLRVNGRPPQSAEGGR
ncbi:MAG TPA: hypothetical protein VN634_02695 [Candidatus Limnocylindrales bacterium]|nr:hypothetical protein [Candidatus Limnocylindrales bacterium]